MAIKDKHKQSRKQRSVQKRPKATKASRAPRRRFVPTSSAPSSNPLACHIRPRKHIPYVCTGPFNRYTYVCAAEPGCTRTRRMKGITDAIFSMYLPGQHKLLLNGTSSADGKSSGPGFGMLIDKELQKWTDICNGDNKLELRLFYATCHPLTRSVSKFFARMGWTPWKAQVPVCSWHAGLGTCIDLLAKDSDGSLILIEVKTGYQDNFAQPIRQNGQTLMLERPLHAIQASPLNYALLQALVSWFMYHTIYSDEIKCSKLYVLHVSHNGVSASSIQHGLMAAMMTGVKHLIEHHTNLFSLSSARRRFRTKTPRSPRLKSSKKRQDTY